MGAPMELMVPPHSVESEQAVIGGLLIDNLAYDRIADMLTESDFYRSDHRLIFRTITRMLNESKPADVITVFDALGLKQEEAGGLAYLTQLVQNTPSSANIKGYAQVVSDRSLLRRLISTCHMGLDLAVARNGKTAVEIVESVEESVYKLAETGDAGDTELPPVGHYIPEVIQSIVDRVESGKPQYGIRTGLDDLDDMLLGLRDSDLIVIAGRPSMGKSTLAFQIAQNHAIDGGKPLVFSMETSRKDNLQRSLSNLSRVELTDIRRGTLNHDQIEAINTASGLMEDSALFIDDRPALTVHQMRARARRIKRKHGLTLIVVDHIGLARGEGENRTQQVGSISRGLKAMAKEFNVPVIALCQLNRGVETRTDKRPMMSDLRESGDVEQDADVVMMLYRDEYYHAESLSRGIAEILVRKQRDGAVGDVFAAFNGPCVRFDNLARDFRPTKAAPRKSGFSDD